MKTITVKSDDNGIVMEWNLEGSGKCEAGTNNPFLENCLKSFAEALFYFLKYRFRDANSLEIMLTAFFAGRIYQEKQEDLSDCLGRCI